MRLWSYSFTAVTVAASIATLWPLLMQADAAMSAQFAPPGPVPLPPQVRTWSGVEVVELSHVICTPQGSRCALSSTQVTAQISGYTARVTVRQVFNNPNSRKIDATYSFPLSNSAAVDEMTMRIGSREVKGSIKKKAEARAVYAAAQAAGRTASLLEQQRTNVFSQSITNIEPGKSIEVELKYTDTLTYSNGKYEFVFPTKVGPRFVPTGSSDPALGTEGSFEGGVSYNIDIDGGMPISNIQSSVLPQALFQPTASTARFQRSLLPCGDDLKLTWEAAADRIESGVVVQRDGDHGYLTVMLVPPKRLQAADVAPKEFVFLVDCSGSQAGEPLQKAKDTLNYIVDHMGANDTFQIVAFNSGSQQFVPHPMRVSAEMKRSAHAWIDRLEANGGTMMAPAVERVCATPAPENRLRIVSFMTDGFVANDYEVINLVKRLRGNSRWFPYGTGNGVNRALIDGIAKEGGGEAEYVDLSRNGEDVGKEFFERISSPVLTDVKVRFEGINVQDVYPKALSDVWAEKPLYFHARYNGWGRGTAVVTGFAAGRKYETRLPISLPLMNGGNVAVGQTWARTKIEDLMSKDLVGIQRGAADPDVEKSITDVALKHHLVSHFTSFVAVDTADKIATYDDPHAPNVVAYTSTVIDPTPAGFGSKYAPRPTNTWNPIENSFNQSFNNVVSQLNSLNSYSAMDGTPMHSLTPVPQPIAANSGSTTSFDNFYRIAALVVMWIASLTMLFRKRNQAKAEIKS